MVSLYLSFPTYSAVPPRLGRCPPRLRVKGQVLSAVSCLAVLRTQPRASAHARQVLTLEPRHGPATLKYKVMWAKAQSKGHKGELEPKGHLRGGSRQNLETKVRAQGQRCWVTGALWPWAVPRGFHITPAGPATCTMALPWKAGRGRGERGTGKGRGEGEGKVPTSHAFSSQFHSGTFSKMPAQKREAKGTCVPFKEQRPRKCHQSAVLPRLLNIAMSFGRSLRSGWRKP